MDWFPIPIFPEGALSASVIVTVWIGITIVALTNLRLGWVLSGLVVPGYMVPLLIMKPTSAAVVFAEGVLTYCIVWFYSEYLTRFTGLSNFFGRDRFFALVLVSVAVRLVSDGWLLPEIGTWLLLHHNLAFDYRSNLHSFGLIIVALIANNFWKTGLLRGVWPMAIQVGLTWIIVRFVLMELTNFNMASLAFMYEDMASSFLATPKAYIILLVSAFIASRLNLFYGWDFSGILVPSLLAMQWFEPHKILTTIIEAAVIIVIAELVLRTPIFRNTTMEGARKLLLFFNISFAYKYVLSWVLIWLVPETKTSDWFGFGYLLATLLALKMHDKGIFVRMTRATLQASLTGVVVATIIGFALVLLPDPDWQSQEFAHSARLSPMTREARPITEVVLEQKTGLYAASLGKAMTVPLQRELDAFAAGVRGLLEYRRTKNGSMLEEARHALRVANYDVVQVGDQYLLLRERQPANHWGVYVLRLNGESRLLVQVPAPVDEAGTFEAGIGLFEQFSAGAFGSAGAARRANKDGASDVLTRPQTIFQMFHREVAAAEALQIRSRPGIQSILHVVGSMPESINLYNLGKAASALKIDFSPHAERNLQRQTMTGNFAELWMTPSDLNHLRLGAQHQVPVVREQINGSIQSLLRQTVTEQKIAAAGSNAYYAPRQDELLRVDREVLSPLLALATSMSDKSEPSEDELAAFAVAALSGSSLGMDVRWLTSTRAGYFLLADRDWHRGWIIIRLGKAANFVIGSPRPLEEAGTLEIALSTFDDLRARVLIIPGAATNANTDGTADVLKNSNRTLFTLANQVSLREMGDEPGAAIMVRAFGILPDRPAPKEDVVLAFDIASVDKSRLTGIASTLINELEQSGLSVRVGSGAADTAGYEATGGPQGWYMNQTRNKHFAVLWVSPLARRQLTEESVIAARRQFAALGMSVLQKDVSAELSARRMSATRLPADLKALAEQYVGSSDVVLLAEMQRRYPKLRFERLDDSGARGAFLLIAEDDAIVQGIMSLRPGTDLQTNEVAVAPGRLSAEDVTSFVSRRARWMVAK